MLVEKPHSALAGLRGPFPGLRPFDSGEELIFRGRQQHADELLRRLANHRFLAVVGTSGSGKSSLVRAGLLPALDRGYLVGATSRWRIAVVRPGMAPIENLAEALRDPDALGAVETGMLRSSSLGLVEAVREAKLTTGESLLVVADQFEELFRYQRRMAEVDGGSEAALFVNLLLTAARRPDAPVYVVLTMRSDFLGDCAQFPGLPEALSESQYLIPRLTREQRRQAIEEPLRLFGAKATPQLVEQLLNDSGDQVSELTSNARYRGGATDPLPVLQHALLRTYLEWKARPPEDASERIDLADYRKAGCMDAALDQHAERVFTRELDEAGRHWAKRIFRCLTTTELGRSVRRPTPLADLYKIIGACEEDRTKIGEVLEILRRENSFLQVNRDSSVDISHESLIWKWKRLSDWVAKEAASAELYRDLAKDAHGKATWGEPKLSSALAVRDQDAWNEDWARQYSDIQFEDVERFLARSRTAVRIQKWIRWLGLAAAVAVLILGVLAFHQRQDLAASKLAQDSLKTELGKRNLNESELAGQRDKLADQIAVLKASQSATPEERARLAQLEKEKADKDVELRKSQEETRKLAAQAQQSPDLLASVKSLQSQLDVAQRERDDAVRARGVAEDKVSSLTKELDSARKTAPSLPQPPTISTFLAEPSSMEQGESVTLRWSVARSTETSIDQGVGNVLANGNRRVSPRTTTTYTLTARGTAGVDSASATVVVKLPPLPQASGSVTNGKPLRTLEGHQDDVFSVAWSPDGKMLASASRDKTIRLWDTANGKLLRTLEGHRGYVYSVAWSPDGKALASAGMDNIRLWEAASGKVLRTLEGHRGYVYSVAWSPDGKALASAGLDNTIRLWEAARGKLQSTRRDAGQDQQTVTHKVVWSPDGSTLASCGTGETIQIWGVATQKPLRTLQGDNWVVSIDWSPDGKMLASGGDKAIQLWDAASGKLLRTLQGYRGFSVAWSPDGKMLASGGDKAIRLWDAASGKLLRTLQGYDASPLAWSPDGKMLASGGDKTIPLWDALAESR